MERDDAVAGGGGLDERPGEQLPAGGVPAQGHEDRPPPPAAHAHAPQRRRRAPRDRKRPELHGWLTRLIPWEWESVRALLCSTLLRWTMEGGPVAVAFLYEGGPGEKAGPEEGAEAEGRPLVPLPWQPSWLRGRREFLKRCRCWPPLVWLASAAGGVLESGRRRLHAARLAGGRIHRPAASCAAAAARDRPSDLDTGRAARRYC